MIAIVFDWETTGLALHDAAPLELQPRGIEFGAVLLDARGQELEAYETLLCPGEPLAPEITKITGLTDLDLAGAPRIAEAMPQIVRVFGQAQLAIAHNLAFDKSILRFELARLGMTEFPWPQHELCTVRATMHEWGRRPKLKELYLQTFGEPLAQKHRALDDVRALARIVVARKLHLSFSGG